MQRLLPFMVVLLCFSSCSNSNNTQGRVAICGNVTLEGSPLENGSIQFESLPEMRPQILTGGIIRQGTFSVPAEQGLLAGQEYTVRIRSVQEIPGTYVEADHTESGPETRDIIPPQYGSESTLTVTATKKSPNVFQFDMVP